MRMKTLFVTRGHMNLRMNRGWATRHFFGFGENRIIRALVASLARNSISRATFPRLARWSRRNRAGPKVKERDTQLLFALCCMSVCINWCPGGDSHILVAFLL